MMNIHCWKESENIMLLHLPTNHLNLALSYQLDILWSKLGDKNIISIFKWGSSAHHFLEYNTRLGEIEICRLAVWKYFCKYT
jgi:hypothetical protein